RCAANAWRKPPMDKRDLLIEVGTEELPPKALLSLSQAFEAEIAAQLRKAGLEHDGIEPFATPRRLALLVRALPTRQPDSTQERLGPAVPAAFDAEGKPTK